MIWGESYAGVYVPTLALAVYKSDLAMKLVEFAVGNPCTDDATRFGLMGCAKGRRCTMHEPHECLHAHTDSSV